MEDIWSLPRVCQGEVFPPAAWTTPAPGDSTPVVGIPKDIVSDWGRQFSFQVWRAFCSALGASASLTLGYRQQAGGEDQPQLGGRSEMCGGLEPISMEHLPTTGGVRP